MLKNGYWYLKDPFLPKISRAALMTIKRLYCKQAAKAEAKKASPKGEAQAIAYAVVCATEALKIDKQAGVAWALLARFVKKNARKIYCRKMAAAVTPFSNSVTVFYFLVKSTF